MTEDKKSLSQRKEIRVQSSDLWLHVHVDKVASRVDDWIEIRSDTGELVAAYFRPVNVSIVHVKFG